MPAGKIRSRSRVAAGGLLGVFAAVVLVPAAASAHVSSTATPTLGYRAHAYGTSVTVGSTVRSGPTANIWLACTTQSGLTRTNTAAGVTLPSLGTTGTVKDVVLTTANAAAARSTIQQVYLLGGMVTARAVSARSRSSYTTAFHAFGNSTLLSLSVNGMAEGQSPAKNTVMALPGVGTLILNEQHKVVNSSGSSLIVNAIHIKIGPNSMGLPVGANIIVGHAVSALTGPVSGLLDGEAYGSSLNVAQTVESGPSALQPLSCTGTAGATVTNTTTSVSIPNGLTTGTVTSTAEGSISASAASGRTTNTVQSANLLSGMVTADTVKAVASGNLAAGKSSFSHFGSMFVNLHVSGYPHIGDNVAPNTKLAIPGVGTLYLYRVFRTKHSIQVRMIELVVTASGAPLPVGADLRVSVAVFSIK